MTDVDIAKIVSKLEEAAKEQKFYENRRQNYRSPSKFNKTPRQRYNSPYQNEYRQDSYKPYYDNDTIVHTRMNTGKTAISPTTISVNQNGLKLQRPLALTPIGVKPRHLIK
ncbi:hypothetical protein QE152_g23295 [Popillia japonica]|uniref:Uncharacterized protein n=1 Tax=Popillia japonica TaxID=7064 RepID=A0AAW1KIT6_POPJA